MRRLAAIDIGTNTILLLVAGVEGHGRIIPLQDVEQTTRLGRELAKTGRLHPDALEKTLQVIDGYVDMCRSMDVDEILMVGTSALREAVNADYLLHFVHRRYGLRIQIISSDEEARLSYLSVDKEMGRNAPLLVLDIGGGSTEFVLGKKGRISDLYSLEIGAVRLTDRFLVSDPVAEEEFQQMMEYTARKLQCVAITPPKQVVGLGGTITTLSAVHMGKSRFDPSLFHGSSLCRGDVNQQVLRYKGMTQAQRLQIPGLPRDRADVILAGATILLAAMDNLGFRHITVSCHGLRYGLLYAATREQCVEIGEK